jgi:hypothetical protein
MIDVRYTGRTGRQEYQVGIGGRKAARLFTSAGKGVGKTLGKRNTSTTVDS